MKIAISKAKAKLSALVNAALAGEKIIITKHGRSVAEIKPFAAKKSPAEKLFAIQRTVAEAKAGRLSGVSMAEADNFLYDDDTGLPS
ncbi:MAG: type II toxin-antitoxin system prevent-host-death family antitoxin [Candidatus Dadabacteria bacterium]|nr:type II toxin-antitoxin system prevent-host-death family antitoxin [Candidatus Dadabacteria bacterium]MDE0477974.1 type II toxin-antitoxin system prevent-host-death family antitoxin [Candidatus Dadabacteria bacterium]